MLIITADDYGKSKHATNSIIQCFDSGRVTSASAMVFMEDSERAASLALETELEIGLHLNFTMPYNSNKISSKIRDHQNRVVSYLNRFKLSQLIYNPILKQSFEYLYLSQEDEINRLYGKTPVFYNGHHHMHLCANVLLGGVLPEGGRVRRTFTFYRGEKNLFNRVYRDILDNLVSRKFISSDSFFSIVPIESERLRRIFASAEEDIVEIEVHPENREEMDFLLSDRYLNLIESVHKGGFSDLKNTKASG
jgi:predicted glycoside hydrolase/deacetylase ChbG (UPF0249 family)